MTISRGQMPRQLYGLGSLVKSITKPFKKVAKGVKKFALPAAALYFGSQIPIGSNRTLGSLFGDKISGILSSEALKKGLGKVGDVALDVGVGSLIGGALDYFQRRNLPEPEEKIQGRSRGEIEEVISGLKTNYENLGYEPGEIDLLVEQYINQNYPGYYRAEGGRIGFANGAQFTSGDNISPGTDTKGNVRDDNPFTGGGGGGDGPKGPPSVINPPPKTNSILDRINSPFKKFAAHDKFTDMMKMMKVPNYHQMGGFDFMARFPDMNPEVAKGLASAYQNVFELGRAIADGPGGKTIGDALDTAEAEAALNAVGIDAFFDPTSEIYKQYTNPATLLPAVQLADGGRINYAKGDTAEQNAMQASGIMDLPLNQNPAGITELDLRESGGFIPPVGVKEKADDIPAMLSNN